MSGDARMDVGGKPDVASGAVPGAAVDAHAPGASKGVVDAGTAGVAGEPARDRVGGAASDPVSASARTPSVNVHDFPGGLRSCLEAVLMAADEPQTTADLARVLDVAEADVLDALRELRDDYDGGGVAPRGFELRESVRGWRLCSRRSFAPVVSRFVTDGQTARLSQAAMEALAIIAYKQPVTRAQVGAIRGVASDGVIRSLTARGLVREVGVDEDGHAALLGTTALFLEMMGLRSLDDLPSLAPFLPSADEARGFSGEGE